MFFPSKTHIDVYIHMTTVFIGVAGNVYMLILRVYVIQLRIQRENPAIVPSSLALDFSPSNEEINVRLAYWETY